MDCAATQGYLYFILFEDDTPRLRRLRVEAEFHSARLPRGGLTVTTTVSMERLHLLEGLCGSWAGPLIAAAYLPLTAGRPSADDGARSSVQDTFSMCAEPVITLGPVSTSEGAVVSLSISTRCSRLHQQIRAWSCLRIRPAYAWHMYMAQTAHVHGLSQDVEAGSRVGLKHGSSIERKRVLGSRPKLR